MATLQITTFPKQVRVEEYLSITGTSQGLAGQPLTLVIDNQYQMGAGAVPSNERWSFRFRFTSAGNRSLVISARDAQGNLVQTLPITLSVTNTAPPPLQVTSFPYQVRTAEDFTINGLATGLGGQPLTLVVDEIYQFSMGTIPANGSWSVRFRFTSPGNRKIVFSAPNAQGGQWTSPAVELLVLENPATALTITTFPQQAAVRQTFLIAGTSAALVGRPVMLTIDNQFRTSAGTIAANGSWQTQFQFLQAGTRRLTAIVENPPDPPVISQTVTVDVVAASPRLTITPPTQPIFAGTEFTLAGEARNLADGEQLVVRADGRFILSRPLVQNQRWQARCFLNQEGQRLIEVIASEQERTQLELTVQPVQSGLRLFSRNIWIATPTPEGLPNLINPKRITLHHTVIAALSSNASQTQEVQRMRRILDIHLNSSGYSDIGYHYIVMPSGRVYEGRSSRKRGAHDVVNDGIGVAVDGDFQGSLRVGVQQYDAIIAICTMLCKRMGITDPTVPVSTTTADFGTRQLPRIVGHQDRVATGCPGTVYERLNEIRQDVKQAL